MSEATKQEATDNVPTAEPTEAAPEVTEDATPEPTEAAPEPTEAAPEVTEAAPEPTEAVLAESPSAATPEPTEAAPEVTEDATEPTMEKPCCVGVIRNADGLTGQTITEGDFPMYVNKPEGGNGIGVMVLHDIFGFEIPNCKYIVDYLASQGFTACMPNLYTGTGSWPATETEIEKPLEGDEFGSWFGKITSEEFWAGHFTKGVTASTGWLKTQGCSNLTTMGFCWGGKAVTVACKTDLFSAGVSLHGAAHSAADVRESKCPLFFCAINGDAFFPETVHEEIRALDTEVKVFPDMYHGFVVRGDFENAPAVKAAAEEALADTCAFFTKHCAAPAPLEKKKSLLNTLTFGLLDDDDDEKKSEKKVEKKKSFMDTLFGGDKEKEVATPAVEEAPAGDVKDTEGQL
jgi:dienelactone hydrolase